MSITSKQESILANLVTSLNNIDGEDNYSLDIEDRTWRAYRHFGDLKASDFPCVMVLDESDMSLSTMTAQDYTTGSSIEDVENAWVVTVLGYVKVEVDKTWTGLLQKELIKLMSDIMIAVMADRSRGGYALSTSILSVSKGVDWGRFVGAVAIDFGIKYDFNPQTPVT